MANGRADEAVWAQIGPEAGGLVVEGFNEIEVSVMPLVGEVEREAAEDRGREAEMVVGARGASGEPGCGVMVEVLGDQGWSADLSEDQAVIEAFGEDDLVVVIRVRSSGYPKAVGDQI